MLTRLAATPEGSTFSDLRAVEPNLYAASLSRLLRVMQEESLVGKDAATGRYRLGPAFLTLARRAVGSAPTRELIHPIVESLAAETGQSVAWFEPDGDRVILIDKAEVPEAFHYISLLQPMGGILNHGFGQVLYAWAGAARRKVLLAAHGPVPGPASDYAKRQQEILDGLLVVPDWKVKPSAIRVVAPVFRGEGGGIVGVLGISLWQLPPRSPDLPRFTSAVMAAARRATSTLKERTTL